MAQDAFRKWKSSTIIEGKSLSIRASVQPKPYPPAVCLGTDVNVGVVTIPLADWPTVVATVNELKLEAGL